MSKTAALLISLLLIATAGVAAADAPAAVTGAAAAVRAAELAFAASVRDRDRVAFAALIADEAIFVSGTRVLRGKSEVLAGWDYLFAADAPTLDWHPEIVEVQSGGLGLSRGPWTFTGKGGEGAKESASGIFNSVWRRQPDGRWQVIIDAGCPPCPVCSPPSTQPDSR